MLLFFVFTGIAAAILAPALLAMNDTLMGVVLLLCYSFVEPVLLAVFGATPFKALLKIRVRKDGRRPAYAAGLVRSLNVWVRGQGLGIPLIAFFASIFSYKRLMDVGITSWDEAGGFSVEHQNVAWWRWLILISALLGFVALMILGAEA